LLLDGTLQQLSTWKEKLMRYNNDPCQLALRKDYPFGYARKIYTFETTSTLTAHY
jgi:hypothetical protein